MTPSTQTGMLQHQARDMEALGQLTGGVAHDFNNLLTAIVGTLELLEMRTTDDWMHRHIAIAQHAANRGAKLTEQLLAFSRKQELQVRPVDSNVLITAMHDRLIETSGSSIELRLDLAADIWPILADQAQLELVLLNFVANAGDAMPDGGRLVVATGNRPVSECLQVSELIKGDCVCISLLDSGSGMSEEVLAKAFEPFFTTKPPGHGSGLGLSQAYGIVRQLDGAVRIQSDVGTGTLVEIFLPRVEFTRAAPNQESIIPAVEPSDKA